MRFIRHTAFFTFVLMLFVYACGGQPIVPVAPQSPQDASAAPEAATQDSEFKDAATGQMDVFVPAPDGSIVPVLLGRPSKRQGRGVNMSGGQFAPTKIPGVYGTDYKYPAGDAFAYFVARGFDHFRVGFLHERIQPKLQGPLETTELARLKAAVKEGTSRGARVSIVPHNNFRHTGKVVNEEQIGDLWGRLAKEFIDDPLVEINITNEPQGMATELVLSLDNAAIKEIRRVGFTGLIHAPANGWTGALNFFATWPGTPSSKVMQGIKDPIDNTAIEVHVYLDAAGSGGSECVSPTIGAERINPWITWLRTYGKKGIVGELGAIDTPMCRLAIAGALRAIEQAQDVVLAWDAWSGGWASFTSTYPMALGPTMPDKPMLSTYRLFGPYDVMDAGLDGSRVAP